MRDPNRKLTYNNQKNGPREADGVKCLSGRFTLTQQVVDEIRLLRMRDPETWKTQVLADKFHTTKGNVSKICNRHNRIGRIDIKKDGVVLRGEDKQ